MRLCAAMKVYMKPNFNRGGFEATYAKALERLQGAEKITKEVLRELSRSVLEAHHATENVVYINQLLAVLTPVNRKVAILYFKAFSGFRYSEELNLFEKKDKSKYDAKDKASTEFLADPHNNIWTWADRHVKHEAAETVSLTAQIEKQVSKWVERAAKDKVKEIDLLKAFFAGGVHPSTILELMESVGYDVEGINPVEMDEAIKPTKVEA